MTTRISSHRFFFILAVFAASVFAFAAPSPAQVEIGASPNPVGSGARATGMGGAFIAVADDATAASWNPAGLVQLESPEISAVGEFTGRRESIRSSTHPELNGKNETSAKNLNYLSAVYPFAAFGRNMVVSLNYQHLYDMNKNFRGNFVDVSGFPFVTTSFDTFSQSGGLSTISPAFAVQITPTLSAGFTVNFWQDPFGSNGWVSENNRNFAVTFFGVPFSTGRYRNIDDIEFSGTNYQAGIMYSPTASLTIGGVYKSGFTANLRRNRYTFNSTLIPTNTHTKDYLELDMPTSYGIGIAYRHSDELTFAVDAYRTEWGQFVMNDNGTQRRPNIGLLESASKMDATTQVRAGGEYLVIMPKYVVPVRAGVFYDPEPSENSPNSFYGISLGSGIAYGPVALDFSYTFRTGRSGESLGVKATDSSIDQHSGLVSAIFYLP